MRHLSDGGPLQPREASLEDIRQAFQSLSIGDWLKLKRYATIRARWAGSNHNADQLLNAAMNSILESGRRYWYPDKVGFPGFLIGAMRSISSNWARQVDLGAETELCETDLIKFSSEGDELASPLDHARSSGPNPEDQLLDREAYTQEQLVSEIEGMFKDRPLAGQLIEGWRAGMKGPEIIEVLNITETDYKTAARLVRRRIAARWPKGIPHAR